MQSMKQGNAVGYRVFAGFSCFAGSPLPPRGHSRLALGILSFLLGWLPVKDGPSVNPADVHPQRLLGFKRALATPVGTGVK
jgi:hypothetical protein